MLDDLKQHLQARLPLLKGDWVDRNSGYEDHICRILEMRLSTGRYWDAVWNQHLIEFKKGRSIWLDLVRYSEIALKKSEESGRKTVSLFFIPNNERSRIEEIVCVETEALIRAVRLSKQQAESLVEMKVSVPRSLNAQASLTVNDVKAISAFLVS